MNNLVNQIFTNNLLDLKNEQIMIIVALVVLQIIITIVFLMNIG